MHQLAAVVVNIAGSLSARMLSCIRSVASVIRFERRDNIYEVFSN